MGGSSGGGYDTITPSWDDYYDPNKQLFIGATDSQPAANGSAGGQGYTDIAAAMNPALSGQASIANAMPSYSDQIASSISTPSSGTSGAKSFGDWLMSKEGAAALQKTGETLKGPESGTKPPDPKVNPSQLGSGSQVVRGNTQTLSQLLQLLSQRRYAPIGYSGGSSGSTRGLLG